MSKKHYYNFASYTIIINLQQYCNIIANFTITRSNNGFFFGYFNVKIQYIIAYARLGTNPSPSEHQNSVSNKYSIFQSQNLLYLLYSIILQYTQHLIFYLSYQNQYYFFIYSFFSLSLFDIFLSSSPSLSLSFHFVKPSNMAHHTY